MIPVPVSVRSRSTSIQGRDLPGSEAIDRPTDARNRVTSPSRRSGVASPGQAVGGPQPVAGRVVHAREGALAAGVRDHLAGPQVGDHQEAGAGDSPVDQRGRDSDLRRRRYEVHPRLLPDPALHHPHRVGAPEPEVRRQSGEPGGGDDPLVAAEQGNALGGHRARRDRLEGRDWQTSSDFVLWP